MSGAKKEPCDGMNVAFEHFVPDSPAVLFRVMRWSAPDRRGERMRCTDYYTDVVIFNAAVERIAADDLIAVQEFRRK
jgi:hypothetical protein